MSTASRPAHQRATSLNSAEAQQTLLKRRNVDKAVDSAELLEHDLNAIGFGKYHTRLLVLCGLGWLSDNATLQCIAVILPRIQTHYDLPPSTTSLLSASAMAGMALGAYTWGSIADSHGRVLPYHSTILLTGVCNLGASYAGSFGAVCFWMFGVGTAVGGSMPTDGTLFLENLPTSKQYLLTSLSTFFALGAVMSSVVGLLVLPGASCERSEGCDIEQGENDGWRKMLFVLALLDFTMFIARSVLFRLYESPRYLVATRRKDECAKVLSKIAHCNGLVEFTPSVGAEGSMKKMSNSRSEVLFEAPEVGRRPIEITQTQTPPPHTRLTSSARIETTGTPTYGHDKLGSSLSSNSVSNSTLNVNGAPRRTRNPFMTPSEELGAMDWEASMGDAARARHSVDGVGFGDKRASIEEEDEDGAGSDDDDDDGGDRSEGLARKEGYTTSKERLMAGLDAWTARFRVLFGPQWRRTTGLMIYIWMSMALAYGMFNVWLPTVLEQRSRDAGEGLYDALLEYVWFSIAGIPGSIFGGWLVETKLGRRKSLALSTVLTACMTFTFSQTTSKWAEVVSTCMLSNAAVTMYAILYGMTPETFTTSLRGTAVGFLAALSRIAGIAAPILAGSLLARAQALPLICSAIVFASTAVCAVLLPFERAPGTRSSGAVSMAH